MSDKVKCSTKGCNGGFGWQPFVGLFVMLLVVFVMFGNK